MKALKQVATALPLISMPTRRDNSLAISDQQPPVRDQRSLLTDHVSRLRPASRLVFAAVALLTACAHLGPRTVPVDRLDYSSAIADSWKEQTLLNIVKLRYMDLPVFVDVSSVVAGYSLQSGVTVNGVLSSKLAVQGNYASVGGQVTYTDRPTITYVPLMGEKFLRGIITPIDPKNIFFMLQAGYPADFILGLTVDGINGLRNRSVGASAMREADPEFVRVLELMREVQAAGAFGMRVEEDKSKGSTGVVFFRSDDVPESIAAKGAELRRLLKLSPEGDKFTLSYSPVRGMENELAVNSRSMLQIMGAFASYLDVPEAHLKDHSAVPALEDAATGSRPYAVRIHSGREKPAAAFIAIPYREHWFWVDDSDWQTKRALMAVMYFFTLADTGDTGKLPLVTIPAQ